MNKSAARSVVISGAASGIGEAAARRFAEDGFHVYCVDRDAEGARRLANELGDGAGGARAVTMDVVDEAAWQELGATVAAAEAPLRAVVHAAGISEASPLVDTALADWRRVLRVNLDGAFLATRFALRSLADGGALVLVGSASGIRAAPGAAAYSSSKAALSMLARVAAKECGAEGRGLRVNVVSPGGVKTPLWRSMPFFQELVERLGSEAAAFAEMEASGPGGAFLEPAEVAEAIRYLASDAARHAQGVELPLDDGYTL
jgi:NAD(P)-dependent dehydrogenase (short-subunit alcohol dehydrogenase family)